MPRRRKVLVVGSGGREHALAIRLLESESVGEVVVLPGNAGTRVAPVWASGKTLRSASGDALAVARSEAVDLVVVGPEGPLCAGISDEIVGAGIPVFGPSRAAAELEGSKAFMKAFAVRHGLPTARHVVVRDAADAERAVRSFSAPPVVKADGLCAGKGVVVADSHDEALEAARGMLSGKSFGDAGKTVVLEERVIGAEASVHAISDGERFVVLPAAQDHKRIGDGDRGPNTGGMGTYAPAPLLTPALAERVKREIFAPAFAGLKRDGMPYKGALFAGLMITASGDPILLEFNVRFGDPETQVLVMTTGGDFGEAFASAASGTLSDDALVPNGEHAVCIVLAADGYPDAPKKGDAISGIEAAESLEGVRVFHAGTSLAGGELVTAGGRVLGVTARAGSLLEAHARAYAAAERVHFAGAQFRRDIARRALG
jgi:phosphoribosylamine---glycine ligase